jgi:signal transduction histidine kinase
MFAFSGVSSHQNSMRDLAVDENSRLITALALLIDSQRENYAWEQAISIEDVAVEDLNLNQILAVEHPHAEGAVAVIDASGGVLFHRGDLPSQDDIRNWIAIAADMSGSSRVFFTSDQPQSDVIAIAVIPDSEWSLLIVESWHSLTDPLVQIEQLLPFVLFTAIIISFFTLIFGLRYVVRPLQELGIRANLIGEGHFDAVAEPVGGVREIEDLRSTLDHVAKQLQNYQLSLQDYLRALTQAQEEERARLGRELHDETVQSLIALSHKAQMVQRSFERDPAQATRHIQELREMTGKTIEEVRRFSRALHPHYLDELGLVTALEMLAREASATFQVIGTVIPLSPEQELAFYRIAQEALNNAKYHAEAEKIDLSITFTASQVRLEIQDSGKGFTVPIRFSDLTHSGHFGLVGMRERAQLIGADLQIQSVMQQGTTIALTFELRTNKS